MAVTKELLAGGVRVKKVTPRPAEVDLSAAEVVVAVGRGLRSRDDLALAQELTKALGGQLACTRPLVECGWMDPRRQIGLSGRTVAARLIITLGISGSVQFAAGMSGSACILAVNSDPEAAIFKIAHYGFVCDLYEALPVLLGHIAAAAGPLAAAVAGLAEGRDV